MATNVAGQSRGITILWQPCLVEFSNLQANKFSLMVDFCHMDSGVGGTLGNIYGPNNFPKKQSFMDLLNWFKEQSERGTWVLGGDFNLIANLGEKKGGRRSLDKYQEAFCEFLSQSSLVDVEIGNLWYTSNNKRGGEHLVGSCLDRFLVSENIMHNMREIMGNIL